MNLSDLLSRLETKIHRHTVLYGTHLYRVISQNGDTLNLQAVASIDGLPNQIETPKAHGIPGVSSECRPGSLVCVAFRNGKRGQPYVVSYLDTTPINVTIDASSQASIGPSATTVALAGGTRPVAMGDSLDVWITQAHLLLVKLAQLTPGSNAEYLAELSAYQEAITMGWMAERVTAR
ncbi:hypothetical protein BE21_57490 [Sorangium cellulosum]|uniref:Gp5/Type VI secretion system Vgr protein OB-fold domain-containing protein n=1 Tax=Sorangium cellulosum TaxID=56 RepID=A0A150U3F9_SORCE|nr:hypothetical protein BE21_57490 [Sorangium cellulosum]